MQLAQRYARRFDQHYIGTEHVLLALAEQDDFTRQVLKEQRLTLEQVIQEVTRLVGKATHPSSVQEPALAASPRLQRAIERAMVLAQAMKQTQVDAPHLLLALLADAPSAGCRALVNMGVAVGALHGELYRRVAPAGEG